MDGAVNGCEAALDGEAAGAIVAGPPPGHREECEPYRPLPRGGSDNGGMGDKRSPLSVRETIVAIVAIVSLVGMYFRMQATVDGLDRRMLDIGTSFAAAVAEFRTHAALPGHAVERAESKQLKERMANAEATVQEVLREVLRRGRDGEPPTAGRK